MGNRESQLSSVPAQKLDWFIQEHLKPYEECQTLIDRMVTTICEALQDPEQFPLVQGVAIGGSYGRETVLRGNSDGTLVLFFGDLKQFQDQKRSQHDNLVKTGHKLNLYLFTEWMKDSVEIQMSHDGFSIQVFTKDQRISFEVLAAFNALGLNDNPSPWIYRELKRSLDKTNAHPGEFAVCFTELQQRFFNNCPRKLKDLILLIKHWHQQCQKKMNGLPLLSPYALELLTVYAWEQGCRKDDFDIAEGVRTVLGLIKCEEQLCIYWMVNYNFENETVRNVLLHQLQSERPVILDPTDPTNNVSGDNRCWQRLKQEAQTWLTSPSLDNELPAPSWNVLPAPLFTTPGHRLDKFIKDFLQPDKYFLEQVDIAINIICKFLEENCFRQSTAKIQTVQGGSTAKGTALKTGSDADLVVFHNSLKSYTSPKNERHKIFKEIHQQLEAFQRQKKEELEVRFEISKWKAPRVLSFSLKSKVLNQSVNFDVLPAFNALGQLSSGSTSSPEVYAGLIDLYKSSDLPGGEFSTCFTALQRNFIRSQDTKLKDLIRLVKHWYKECERKLKPKGSLPPKYALELLTVYAWEQGSGVPDFDTAEGFRTVLELVTQYQQLCIFWKINYNFEDETVRKFLLSQLQKTRPVILDPAEPTGDVGGGDRWCWHLLAKEAKEWLCSLCFKDGSGNPIPPWKVPVKVI
ncbi:2'-5'-oligoadenylate synthase 2 isoform X2 [Aotus nancymaae]|uniref:2'-5'-oligoadenylate synthase 2 isoform X2 n=2 Tax=Aotus nancymaae TaxID=37293 RepID=UPI0030FE722F